MNSSIKVAILCAAPNSSYYDIEGVEVYDKRRDARTFPGGMPVVAHPPCRAWSAFCSHQAKPEPGEKELGIWVVDQFRTNGGVLEQSAFSRLFDAGALPKPGKRVGDLWTMYVSQAWWGYPMLKKTWLCFNGVDPKDARPPLRFHDERGDHKRWKGSYRYLRSHTVPSLAEWLVSAARTVGKE